MMNISPSPSLQPPCVHSCDDKYQALPPPYVHLASTHVMNAPRSSPFFAGLPLPCIIVNANGRYKLGRSGNETFGHKFVWPYTDSRSVVKNLIPCCYKRYVVTILCFSPGMVTGIINSFLDDFHCDFVTWTKWYMAYT